MTTSTEYHVDDFQRAPESKDHPIIDRANSKQTHLQQNDGLILDIRNRKFGQQYASVYYMRLEMLKTSIKKAASEAWNGLKINDIAARECKKVLDVSQGQLLWLVGTVYKEMKYKPNILEEVSAKTYGAPPVRHERYFNDDDQVLLEDESGRMELCGEKISTEMLVTGTIVAVLGIEDSAGNFQVIDLQYPGLAPQVDRPIATDKTNRRRKYVAIASGLQIGSKTEDPVKLNMLQELLSGELGGMQDAELASSISMLVLAGNSIAIQEKEYQDGKSQYGRDNTVYNGEPMKRFDRFVSDILMTMPVSVMPGEDDPATATMPQQPLHKGLLPSSRKFAADESKMLTCVTNPYTYDVDGVHILGTAGQTIDDIYKYADFDNRLEMMASTLKWRHIAPTCPDTLWSYPFADNDPFVLKNTPHVYFAGNQAKFATKVVTNEDKSIAVRLITVPRFDQTGEVVLLDLESLEARTLKVSG